VVAAFLIHHPLGLADDVERRPRLFPELAAIGQSLMQRPAGRHDHPHLRI
jgi:hypothetical protein